MERLLLPYRAAKNLVFSGEQLFLNTSGLILRESKYKDSDKILTILCGAEGKFTASARRVLRTKSRLGPAIQLFSFSEFVLFGNKGRWTINEARTIEEFRGLRNDISSLALAAYFADLLELVSDEDMPNPNILRLALNSFYALSNKLYDRELIKAVFELRLASYAGYMPNLVECAECGKNIDEYFYFRPELGDIVCKGCRGEYGIKITYDVLSAMRYIVTAEARRIFSFKISEEGLRQLSGITENYILLCFERQLKSLDYYRKIIK